MALIYRSAAMTELEMETKRADQLGVNCKWLIDKIDEICNAICPDKIGTWQQRAEWAALKAKELATANNSAMVQCSCGSRDVFVSLTKSDVYWCRSCRNMWTTQHQ